MRMLEAAGYHAVAPEQVVSWLDGKTNLPENAVLLTFDAARADVVLNAAPVLKDVDMRATVFPIGGAYEKNPVWFASPEQLRELESRFGWSIGAFAGEGPRRDRGRGRRVALPVRAGARREPGRLPRAGPRGVRRRAPRRRRHRHPPGRRLRVALRRVGRRPPHQRPRHRTINLEEARELFRLGFTLDAQESFRLLTRADDPLRVARLAVSAEWTPADLLERLNVAAAASAPELTDATS